MAKLSARGRTELARVAKTYPAGDVGQVTTYTYALMSDGKILRKTKVLWADGYVTDKPWKVVQPRYPTRRDDFVAYFATKGYPEVQK